ncbi:MAG: lipoate protein ligase C-terminal domain-containing protein, partial [Clostridiaceae bacterium]
DMQKLSRYLAPSQMKLEAKGVKSVISRVTNLGLQNPELNVETMKRALEKAFCEEYGEAEPHAEESVDAEKLEQVRARYASWEWRFGCTPSFNVSFENRFSFGCLELLFNVQGGVISNAVCYTDAMDATLALRLQELLTGSPYGKQPLVDRLSSQTGAEEREIAVWLGEQSI